MTDYEDLLSNFIEHQEQGRGAIWHTCEDAFALFDKYGDYSRDTVATLTQACHLSDTAIYNRKDAWSQLLLLFGSDADSIKNPPLSPSHFYRLHHLRRVDEKSGTARVNMDDKDAAALIAEAIKEGWSSEMLVETATKRYGADGRNLYVAAIRRWWKLYRRIYEDLEQWQTLPDEVQSAVHAAGLAVEEWLNDWNIDSSGR
jgi:hypothetical protein